MVAPASNIKRPLRFWEQICSNMGVTMGFELEGKVTPQIVKDAFAAIQKEYPYLRTVLTNDMNQLAFVEQPVVRSILHQLISNLCNLVWSSTIHDMEAAIHSFYFKVDAQLIQIFAVL